jgi:hypothetical protein
MKKQLSYILAALIAMVIIIIGGCGGASSGGSNPAVVTPPSGTTTALSVFQSGMYDLDSERIASGTTSVTVWATHRMGLAADGMNFTDTYTYFDQTSKIWTTTPPAQLRII